MFRVSCIQLCSSDNVIQNLKKTKNLFLKAIKQKTDFILTPEVSSKISLNKKKLMKVSKSMKKDIYLKEMRQLAKKYKKWVLIGSLILKIKNKLVNRSVLISASGKINCYYDKIHMFDANVGDGKHYCESNSFAAGNTPVIANLGGIQLGMSICYDLRFAHLYRQLARDGAHIIAVPAAFTAVSGAAHWHVLLRARAIETQSYIIAPAQHGRHSKNRSSFGHSVIIDPWGRVLAELPDGDGFALAEINEERVSEVRAQIPSLLNKRAFRSSTQ